MARSSLGAHCSGAVRNAISHPGRPLPPHLLEFFEARFGRDFASIRIHTGEPAARSARMLGARAYTVHNHIVCAEAAPPLDVLAHELAHAVQQSASAIPETLGLADPDSPLEREARDAARQVLVGGNPRIPARQESRGLLLCIGELDPLDPCPGQPAWESISAGPNEISGPANKLIEDAYLLDNMDHAESIMMVGSEYLYGEKLEIQLPRGAPNKAFGNYLLKELRGLSRQLAPDIVDFKRRVFYEIKTAKTAERYPGKVINQLNSYYSITEAIRRQYGATNEPSWDQHNATWKPPIMIPLPAISGIKIVCTAKTDYTKWPNGLVLYDVRRLIAEEERKAQAIARVQVDAQDQDAGKILPRAERLRAAMEALAPAHPAFVAIAPNTFWQDFQSQASRQRMRSTEELMQVKLPPILDTRTPIGQFHRIGWMLLGITGVAMVAAFWIPIAAELLLASGGAAAVDAAVGTGASATIGTGASSAAGQATVTSLAAYRAMRASKAAIDVAKAAGVLVVIGVGRTAAAATQVNVSVDSAIRIVPIEDFKPFKGAWTASSRYDVPGDYVFRPSDIGKDFDISKTVLFDSAPHTIIARFSAIYRK